MWKHTKTPLTPEQQRVYPIMIALAYRWRGRTYTTADLLDKIPNQLGRYEKSRLGRRFARYATKHPQSFQIIRSNGNHRYYTK